MRIPVWREKSKAEKRGGQQKGPPKLVLGEVETKKKKILLGRNKTDKGETEKAVFGSSNPPAVKGKKALLNEGVGASAGGRRG